MVLAYLIVLLPRIAGRDIVEWFFMNDQSRDRPRMAWTFGWALMGPAFRRSRFPSSCCLFRRSWLSRHPRELCRQKPRANRLSVLGSSSCLRCERAVPISLWGAPQPSEGAVVIAFAPGACSAGSSRAAVLFATVWVAVPLFSVTASILLGILIMTKTPAENRIGDRIARAVISYLFPVARADAARDGS